MADKKIEEAKENAKKVAKIAAGKLDEYYNKLPLDKINEKFGGKIDVKSKKVKLMFLAVIGILLILIGVLILGNIDPKLSAKELKRANEIVDIYHGVEGGLKQIKYIKTEKSKYFKVDFRMFEAVGTKDNGETVKFEIIVPQGMGFDEEAIEVVRK